MRSGALALLLCAAACADDASSHEMHGSGDAGDLDAGAAGTWTELLSAEWTLPAMSDRYVCVRQTLDESVLAGGLRLTNSTGTHHTTLTIGDSSGPDGVEDCGPFDNHDVLLGGSGRVGLVEFPEGLALELAAGKQLLWNIHLTNGDTEDTIGIARVEVLSRPAAEHVASGALTGSINFELPAGETTIVKGQCTMGGDVTLVAVIPHMHDLGTHVKVVAESSIEGDVVVHDEDFDVESQDLVVIDPVELSQGDVVRVECTYENATGAAVHFGQRADAEMCWVMLIRYPALEEPFTCIQ